MKSLIYIAFAILVAAVCSYGKPQNQTLTAAIGTNTTASATSAGVQGYIEAVYVSVSDGSSTGTVNVTYAPPTGGTSVNTATNAVTDEKVWRPRVDATDVAGAALTSDGPVRYSLGGDTVTFAVSGSPTGLTWTCVLVIDED